MWIPHVGNQVVQGLNVQTYRMFQGHCHQKSPSQLNLGLNLDKKNVESEMLLQWTKFQSINPNSLKSFKILFRLLGLAYQSYASPKFLEWSNIKVEESGGLKLRIGPREWRKRDLKDIDSFTLWDQPQEKKTQIWEKEALKQLLRLNSHSKQPSWKLLGAWHVLPLLVVIATCYPKKHLHHIQSLLNDCYQLFIWLLLCLWDMTWLII